MTQLPPDLSRLGDALTDAAARAVAARRARREMAARLPAVGLTGALVFAALTPSHLSPAVRPADLVAAAPALTAPRMACDQPRGARFTMPRGCLPARPQLYPSPLGGRAAADRVVVRG